MSPLAKRLAALERAHRDFDLSFRGLLEFDGRSESPDDAARRAPGPGIFLLLNSISDEGHACEVASDGTFAITSTVQ